MFAATFSELVPDTPEGVFEQATDEFVAAALDDMRAAHPSAEAT
jgi:hypothetical protein